jgi:hypothetical protein
MVWTGIVARTELMKNAEAYKLQLSKNERINWESKK